MKFSQAKRFNKFTLCFRLLYQNTPQKLLIYLLFSNIKIQFSNYLRFSWQNFSRGFVNKIHCNLFSRSVDCILQPSVTFFCPQKCFKWMNQVCQKKQAKELTKARICASFAGNTQVNIGMTDSPLLFQTSCIKI